MSDVRLAAGPGSRVVLAQAAPREVQHPIVPRGQPALRSLMIAMSVMCYLACLAMGALILVNRSVDAWTADIAREVTLQVLPEDGFDIEAQVARATEILTSTPGVMEVRVLDKSEAIELLEPWLGRGRLLDELPVPRLIAASVDQANPPDFTALSERIKTEVKGANLDTHRRWQGELTRLAAVLRWLSVAILALIAVSAALLVVHVTRSALEANRDAVEVLHLVGARDRFIARQVERRFLATGFRAGLTGAAGGIATFAGVSLAGSTAAPESLAEASRSLIFGPPDTTIAIYAVFLIVPVLATLICLVTARLAVLRILRETF